MPGCQGEVEEGCPPAYAQPPAGSIEGEVSSANRRSIGALDVLALPGSLLLLGREAPCPLHGHGVSFGR